MTMPGRSPPPLPARQTLIGDRGSSGEGWLAGIVLSGWASLLGFLVAEIFGSLRQLIEDTDELYRVHVLTVILGMGFDPAMVELCADRQVGPNRMTRLPRGASLLRAHGHGVRR